MRFLDIKMFEFIKIKCSLDNVILDILRLCKLLVFYINHIIIIYALSVLRLNLLVCLYNMI